MKRLLIPALVCLTAALAAPRAAAQAKDPEDIFTKTSKPGKAAYRAFITKESPRGIVLQGMKTLVPADDITDIFFQVEPIGVRINAYRPATLAEKTALTSTKEAERTKALQEALSKYEEALPGLKEGQPFAKSHIAYKIAYLRYLQAQATGKEDDLKAAAAKLQDFAQKHPKAWQRSRTLQTLAQVQLDLKQYAEAEKTYEELAKADVEDEVKQDAQVQALLVSVQAGSSLQSEGEKLDSEGKGEEAKAKFAEAQKRFGVAEGKLQGLMKELPKSSRQQFRARLALAECLGVAKKTPEAKALVKGVLDETKDKGLRTLAYNTLGYCYFANKQWQDARWEFLWVDMIYNQDKYEHAKALYYLSEIFARLGEGDRSRECLDLLRTDQAFSGSEYQRRALREEKTQ